MPHTLCQLKDAIEKKRTEMINLSASHHLQSQEVIEASTTLDTLINQYINLKHKRKSATY
ncbi:MULTISPECIES: aspartyl-phosphate phosphatase Spo0E family protein [Bacillus]|uniref:aspartyl-phosphate phosphatase Spo0E family protein n=1 Tax=Bacillus TaxID=1386 RepID=UPI000BB9258A|nr:MULTISPECIES: aspartyl-phosphate phosphatase Spo0E family protein [Bacillus]